MGKDLEDDTCWPLEKQPTHLAESSDNEPVVRLVRRQINVDHSYAPLPLEEKSGLAADVNNPQNQLYKVISLPVKDHHTGLLAIRKRLCFATIVYYPVNRDGSWDPQLSSHLSKHPTYR